MNSTITLTKSEKSNNQKYHIYITNYLTINKSFNIDDEDIRTEAIKDKYCIKQSMICDLKTYDYFDTYHSEVMNKALELFPSSNIYLTIDKCVLNSREVNMVYYKVTYNTENKSVYILPYLCYQNKD